MFALIAIGTYLLTGLGIGVGFWSHDADVRDEASTTRLALVLVAACIWPWLVWRDIRTARRFGSIDD